MTDATKKFIWNEAVKEHINEFALAMGVAYGSLNAPETVAYLKERGVSEADIKAFKKCWMSLTRAFYRDPKSTGKSKPTAKKARNK